MTSFSGRLKPTDEPPSLTHTHLIMHFARGQTAHIHVSCRIAHYFCCIVLAGSQVSRSPLATRQLVAYRALGGVLLYLTHALCESATQTRSLGAMKAHLLALVEQGQAGPLAALHTAIAALPAEEAAGGKQKAAAAKKPAAKAKRGSTKRGKEKEQEPEEAAPSRKSRRLAK